MSELIVFLFFFTTSNMWYIFLNVLLKRPPIYAKGKDTKFEILGCMGRNQQFIEIVTSDHQKKHQYMQNASKNNISNIIGY